MHIVLSFLFCFIFALSVNAQDADFEPITGSVDELGLSFLKEQSGVEVVGMSYFTAAGLQPDFKQWASKTYKTSNAPVYDREAIATSEFNRLQNKFANFEADTAIVVHAAIDLKNYSERQQTLFLPYFYPDLYFPYDVYGMPVAVLVQNVDRFSKVSIPGPDSVIMQTKMGGNTGAIAELTLLPILADPNRTLPLDGTEFHPLLVKMAQFAIWTEQEPRVPLWVWRDPSYQPKENKELINLYKK